MQSKKEKRRHWLSRWWWWWWWWRERGMSAIREKYRGRSLGARAWSSRGVSVALVLGGVLGLTIGLYVQEGVVADMRQEGPEAKVGEVVATGKVGRTKE